MPLGPDQRIGPITKKFIKKYKSKVRSAPRDIKLNRAFKVLISAPKHSIPQKQFERYVEPSMKLKNFLEKELAFEVVSYPQVVGASDSQRFISYKKVYNLIIECEIMIFLLYDNFDDRIIFEIAWAIEQKKRVFICTTRGKEYLPDVFQISWPPAIDLIDVFLTPAEACEWLINNASEAFNEELGRQNKIRR